MADSSAVVPSGSSEPESSARQNEEASENSQEVNARKEVGGSTVKDNNTSNNACAQEKLPSKGKGLSVVFPRDSLVLGYMEPPNPWKNVDFCDTGDLLTSYRSGCDNNNVKPLTKVQQQLHGIENNLTRYEILSLKGEKIDHRHVESFEELFRRVQFKTLDFEGSHLDDESSVALFDMIEFYESACKLNISFNKNIGVRGWQSCARLIKRTPCLVHLDVRNCDLTERVMPIIGRSLKLGAHLTTLHLENTYLSGRVLLILVAALKMNEVLQELFLADNKLMPSDAIQLGNLLKFNHKLYLLDLRNNHLQDVGVGHLSDGLYEQNLGKGLNTLVLWNNQITYQGMPALTRALGSTESIQTLNLGHNNITNEGIYRLKEGLLKNKSLLRIGLQSTKITCEGAVALAEFIADSRQLLRLDLRENDIKTAGLMALSLSIKVNETVTKMDVDRDVKKDSGMKDYADQQRRLQMDITNFLSRNKDLALEREETERRLMEERARENTRLKEEKEKAAKASEESLIGSYLPTCTRIRRPNLLFPVDCPQQTLDSPGLGGTFSFDDWPASFTDSPQPPIDGGNQLVSPPPSELLLSPQYCSRTKAKKLFTVSKVCLVPVSPVISGQSTGVSSLSSLPSLSSSLPGPSSPMNVLSAMQPEFSQPNSEDQLDGTELAGNNVNMLIHQIVSEAVDMHQKGLDISPGTDALENKIDLAVSELKESLFGVEIDFSSASDTGVSPVMCNGFGSGHDSTVAQNVNVDSFCVNNYSGDGKNDASSKSHQNGNLISDNGPDVTSAGNNNKVLSKVDNENCVVNKDPGLHTALTLNGMARELASVLDTLDTSPQTGINSSIPLDEATTPDEFERELDAMLASVNGGVVLTTSTGASS